MRHNWLHCVGSQDEPNELSAGLDDFLELYFEAAFHRQNAASMPYFIYMYICIFSCIGPI